MSAQILYSCILHKISWGCSRGTESNFTAVRRHTELLSFCIFFDQLPTHVDISPLSGLKKYAKKKTFSQLLFLKSTLSVLRCTWTGRINLKIFFGCHINYLSIWHFMCHPWFPPRKASKLTLSVFSSSYLAHALFIAIYELFLRKKLCSILCTFQVPSLCFFLST